MATLKVAEQLQKLTVVQLKEKCRAAGLRVSGRKQELVFRLANHQLQQPDKPSAAPTTTAKPTKAATASTHKNVSTAKRTTTKEKALSSDKTASKDGGKPTKGKVEVSAKKRALTQNGAQKTEKNKNKTRLTYVVWSSDDYLDDGWHSYDGPGDRNVDSEHTSKQKAIARVRQLFFQENPWGLTEKEMRGEEIEESTAGGLLSLSVAPPDSSCWTVCAQPKAEFLREQAERKSEYSSDEDESQSDVDGEGENDYSSEDESDADSREYGSDKKKYRRAAEQVW
ncbi:WWE domain-containing protein [Balamuthia mandrillaris]